MPCSGHAENPEAGRGPELTFQISAHHTTSVNKNSSWIETKPVLKSLSIVLHL
jgi:hypothetical protein